MAYTTINKSSDHFNAKLYTGNGASSQAITGVGHQPDLVWLKDRTEASNHQLQDSVRGKSGSNYYYVHSDSNAAQSVQSDADGVNTFGTDGFTVGYYNSTAWNKSGNNYVSWNWKAANSAGSSNSSGSITSTVSANTTAGFSIVKYTGTGANATVGHGLGVAPSWILFKNLSSARNWIVYHKSIGATKNLYLDLDNAANTSSTTFNDTAPTSTVFSIGTSVGVNESGDDIIAYCFAEKAGFSKFGRFTANANANGPFLYCGFRPRLLIIKRDNSAAPWSTVDAARNTHNQVNLELKLDTNAADANQTDGCDFLSNGVKLRDAADMNSGNNDTFVYHAFAEAPLVGSNNIPCNAR